MKPQPDRTEAVHAACREAAGAILARRATLPGLALKTDGSPVTDADRAASEILRTRLGSLDAHIPVVCEEGAQSAADAARFWLVDPLDGTREFVRGGELFTINVALIERGEAVFGFVHAPVGGASWWGARGEGAFRDGTPLRARALPSDHGSVRVLLSPSESPRRPGTLLRAVLAHLPHALCTGLPGAIKFCRLAQGDADVYPRSVPSCGWDTAAGQAILEAVGGSVLTTGGQPLRYAPAPGWRNRAFIALADARHDWRAVLDAGLAS